MNRFLRCIGCSSSSNSIPFRKILKGTENLDQSNSLGKGSFGEVYRCKLGNKTVAAKIQDQDYVDADEDFEAEITSLRAIDHKHVIKLVGKHEGDRKRVILYEFMPQGSLDNHLYPPEENKLPNLDWTTRMKIAIGIAEALDYIHERCKIIHRDIKAANVLLDDNFAPKLGDFGLAIPVVVGEDRFERQSNVDPFHGTPGCSAPETKYRGLASTKSDVYSYGVFLLHLFIRRIPYDARRPAECKNIGDWFELISKGEKYDSKNIVDVALGNSYSVQGLEEILSTATLCIARQPLARPNMDYVLTLVRRAARFPVQVNTSVPERRSIDRLQSYDGLECLPDHLDRASSF